MTRTMMKEVVVAHLRSLLWSITGILNLKKCRFSTVHYSARLVALSNVERFSLFPVRIGRNTKQSLLVRKQLVIYNSIFYSFLDRGFWLLTCLDTLLRIYFLPLLVCGRGAAALMIVANKVHGTRRKSHFDSAFLHTEKGRIPMTITMCANARQEEEAEDTTVENKVGHDKCVTSSLGLHQSPGSLIGFNVDMV